MWVTVVAGFRISRAAVPRGVTPLSLVSAVPGQPASPVVRREQVGVGQLVFRCERAHLLPEEMRAARGWQASLPHREG